MTPLGVAIHHVVVEKREVVDQLDRHGSRKSCLRGRTDTPGGREGQGWADHLAPGVVHGPAVGVDPSEVIGDHAAYGGRHATDRNAHHRL